ncbi:uncharacterized protein PV09_05231 [Verruconis gallopava]|uniref:DSC E3 ubiquitin ligase complex subunit A n=1 Tax=Verruconis gallopava TaxID=253628 RepID=A0A0D1YS66_9PEZI|nr:uncharacterized protein PV09_05231 [Verruconis gallopava]KIW03462.1 hypothetical protein PV09_05231 [Verruconis gallopava]
MPQVQNDSRLPVFLVILFILWIFPDPPATPLGGHTTLDLTISRESQQLHVVNTTSYGAFNPKENKWLNITGLRHEDGFAWGTLDEVKSRARQHITHIWGDEDAHLVLEGNKGRGFPVWKNISGHVRGSWVRAHADSAIPRPKLNMTALLPLDATDFTRRFERNVTGESGDLRVEFTENGDVGKFGGIKIQNIKAEIVLSDKSSSGDGWTVVMYGTHLVDTGQVFLTTTSDKFAGMWALPQMALTETVYKSLKENIVQRLEKVIRKQKSLELPNLHPYSSVPEGHSEDAYTPHCELIAYFHQHALPLAGSDGKFATAPMDVISEMEEELRYPQGARPYKPPQLRLSALVFSPDCGFLIESKGQPEYARVEGDHLTGEKLEIYIRSSIDYTLLYILVLAGQIYLTMIQMKHSSTPSTRSRISFYTVGMLSLGDGFVGMAFLPLGMLVDSAFTSLLATAFFAFLAVTFFDMRFLLDVWGVQSQERRRAERQRQQASALNTPPQQATTDTNIALNGRTDALPAPVTARQGINSGATPLIFPNQQQDEAGEQPQTDAARRRRELSAMYGKFYLLLLGITFLSLHATSWYPTARSAYMNVLAFAYLSLWTPQIYRNIMRNCRKALLYRFVIGQSVLRILPIGYFYCMRNNVLWVKPDRRVFAFLVGWLWVQIWVLVIQDVLGPRIGVPKKWLPPAYDYHPVLREDDEESKMPIGFTTSPASQPSSPVATRPAESKDKSKRIFDCAICMQNIEVPIVPAGGGAAETGTSSVHGIVSRRLYMMTPCRHIFHTKCLEAAMRYRLQCPVCREGLPPL